MKTVQLCIDAYELGDYATHDLDGYQPLASSKGLSEDRKKEISEHCKGCSHCQAAAELLRKKFQEWPKLGKTRRDYSPINISDRVRRAVVQVN